jgi:hypothetical protein
LIVFPLNETGRSVLHYVVSRISIGVISTSLSLLKYSNNAILPHWFATSGDVLVTHGKPVYSVMQTRLIYGSVWLKLWRT